MRSCPPFIRIVIGLAAILAFGPPASAKSSDAEREYQLARREYYALKQDRSRRRFRHNWRNVAKRFEEVARRYPNSVRAPDALYTAAELLNELSRFSGAEEDLTDAAHAYHALATRHRRHRLGDDAALALGRIYLERMDQPDKAARVLAEALKTGRKGDRTKDLKSLKASAQAEAHRRDAAHKPHAKTKATAASSARHRREEPVGRQGDGAGSRTEDRSPSHNSPPSPSEAVLAAFRRAVEVTDDPELAAAERSRPCEGHGCSGAEAPAASGTSGASAHSATADAALRQGEAPRGGARTAQTGAPSEGLGEVLAASPGSVDTGNVGRRAAETPVGLRAPETVASRGTSDVGRSAGTVDVAISRAVDPAVATVDAAISGAGSAEATRTGQVVDAAPPLGAAELPGAGTDVAAMPAAGSSERATRLRKTILKAPDAQITVADQLGLKVRRVVIDPGHGGHDTGAIGRGGTREKDVALAISLRLAERLREAGFIVVLTRDHDRFVKLEDRAQLANHERGDLFISVHCNAAPKRSLRGIETYSLNTSSDRYSIRLAARENASSEKGMSDLQFILADLATKANTDESARLATFVQQSLVERLSRRYDRIKNLGTKQALFYVLLGAKMPAILVETSFLSNPEDEKRLASKAYQEQVAGAIAAGVQEFLGARQRLLAGRAVDAARP